MGIKSQSLNRFNVEALYNTFLGLTPREQTMAMIVGALALLLLFGLPISLGTSQLSSLQAKIEKGQEDRKKIIQEIDSLRKTQAIFKQAENKFKNGFDSTITTTMETLATQVGIKDRIESLKERPIVPKDLYDELTVDGRLSKVTLPQIVDFVHRIEHHPRLILRMKQIQIEPSYSNRQLMKMSFQVSTFRLQER